MTPEDLSKRITSTYIWLRMGMGIIALSFPLLLWFGAWFGAGLGLEGSMSAYYHANGGYMRDWFVGILFAIGIMLFLYHGFTEIEDRVLNVAGVLALGIALFPMASPGSGQASHIGIIHGLCAIVFFLCIGYICIFHADDTLELLRQSRGEQAYGKYRRTYRVLGGLMVISPLIAAGVSAVFGKNSFTFFAEAVGVWVFATYWLVKSREIHWTGADEKAAKGELEVVKEEHVQSAGTAVQRGEEAMMPAAPGASAEVSLQDQVLGNLSVQEVQTN